ncbi:hypothetical protein D3C87_1231360 [compost metagenome]
MMQFESLYEYIDQVYDVQLDKAFLQKEAPSLTYLKLVRILSRLRIDTTGQTAVQLFSEAMRWERLGDYNKAGAILVLADLHEIIETLIRKSGKKLHEQFDDDKFADDINS